MWVSKMCHLDSFHLFYNRLNFQLSSVCTPAPQLNCETLARHLEETQCTFDGQICPFCQASGQEGVYDTLPSTTHSTLKKLRWPHQYFNPKGLLTSSCPWRSFNQLQAAPGLQVASLRGRMVPKKGLRFRVIMTTSAPSLAAPLHGLG